MRSVHPPPINDVQVLDRIIAGRRRGAKPRMQAVRDIVVNAYQEYRKWPLLPVGLVPSAARDFCRAYENGASAMVALRNELFAHYASESKDDLCPYCLVELVSDLDHWLPMRDFPEYSVLSKNLVPSCHRCNEEKGRRWKTVAGERVYPHPYFDDAGSQRVLVCSLTIGGDGVSEVGYSVVPGNTPYARVFANLFQDLKLRGRFCRRGAEEWSRFCGFASAGLTGAEPDSVQRVRGWLAQSAAVDVPRFGDNHWASALWRAASQATDADLLRAVTAAGQRRPVPVETSVDAGPGE